MTIVKTEGYTNVLCVLGKCYLFNSFLKNEDISNKILHVALLENYTQNNSNLSRTILYTVGGGPLGFLFAQSKKNDVQIECLIYLNDERQIQIETNDRKLIKYLMKFMHVYKKRRFIK